MGVVGDAEGVLAGVEDVGDDAVDTDAAFHFGENVGSVAAHLEGIAFHHREVGADGGGEVDFVDHQQIALGDAGTAFARDLVTAGDVDDLDREVGEFAAVAGGEVVAAGLDEKQIRMETLMEVFEGEEIGGDIFADGGVGAAAGFDGGNAFLGKGVMADEKLPVFLGEDVVGDGAETQAIAQSEAELKHESSFAAADGAADADGEGASFEVAMEGLFAEMEVAWMIEVFVGMAVGSVVMAMRMGVRMAVRGNRMRNCG